MKKIISLLILTTLSQFAHADYNLVTCNSIRGTNRELSLIVVNQDLKQIRVQTGTRSHALIPTRVTNQNIEGITLYTVSGAAGLMEVDNNVLLGNGGNVRLLDDVFSCI